MISLQRRAPLAALLCTLGVATGLSVTYGLGSLQIALLTVFFLFQAGSRSFRGGFLRAWLYAFSWLTCALSWLYVSMHDYGGIPAPLAALALAAFTAGLSLFYGLAGGFLALCMRQAQSRGRLWVYFVFLVPAFWTAAIYLRATLLTGFGWGAAAYAHVGDLFFGLAPWVGSLGIDYVVTVISALLAYGIYSLLLKHFRPLLYALAGVAALCLLSWGADRFSFGEPGPVLSFRLVQGGIGQAEKFSPMGTQESFLRYYEALNDPSLSDKRIVVLPETIFSIPIDRLPPALLKDFLRANRERSVPLIFGGFQRTLDGSIANGAIYLDKTHRESLYLKRHLVPFGEFVPPGFRWLVDAMAIPMVDQKAGSVLQKPFVVGDSHLAVSLCYEDLFPMEIRQWWQGGQPPSVLVNLSNLGWFGDSFALPQHLNISRMRAKEFARPMVRATNTGMTAAINEKGEVVAELTPIVPGILDVDVETRTGAPTPFARYGETPTLLFLLLVTLSGMLLLFARSKAPKSLE